MVDRRALLIGAGMAGASLLASARIPGRRLADDHPFAAETAIPRAFGPWQAAPDVVYVLPPPDLQAKMDAIYSQVVARAYVNAAGQRVMLMVAYSANQADVATQVHLPDICYPAAGFQIRKRSDETLAVGTGALPVVRLIADAPGRFEPLTYWITVGMRTTRTELERRIVRARYTLQGLIPDGMLVRVSTVGLVEATAFALQADFVGALYAALAATDRERVFGAPA